MSGRYHWSARRCWPAPHWSPTSNPLLQIKSSTITIFTITTFYIQDFSFEAGNRVLEKPSKQNLKKRHLDRWNAPKPRTKPDLIPSLTHFKKKKKNLVSTAKRKPVSSTTKSCIVSIRVKIAEKLLGSRLESNCSCRHRKLSIEMAMEEDAFEGWIWGSEIGFEMGSTEELESRVLRSGFPGLRIFHGERERERDYFRVRTLTRGGSGAGLVMHRGNRLWAPPVGPVLARAPPVWPTLGTSRRHPKSQPLAERMSKWVPT